MIGIVSISKQGNALSARLAGLLDNATCYTLAKWNLADFKPINGKLKEFCGELFQKHEALIFIMASGIVVRSISPWIKDKKSDPAVVVIDDKGQNVISLLSGHLGGANALCRRVAEKLSAHAVITTSSDVNKLPSVDMLALQAGLKIDSMEDAKRITAMIVNREGVELVDDYQIFKNELMPIPDGESAGKIIISNKKKLPEEKPFVKLIPANIYLGVGCRKDTEPEKLNRFVSDSLERFNIDSRSIKAIASISVKENEEAIHDAANALGCQLKFFSKETLEKVDNLFEGSVFVKSAVGVASVSTTAAYMAGKQKGTFLEKKEVRDGMTLSIFEAKKEQ